MAVVPAESCPHPAEEPLDAPARRRRVHGRRRPRVEDRAEDAVQHPDRGGDEREELERDEERLQRARRERGALCSGASSSMSMRDIAEQGGAAAPARRGGRGARAAGRCVGSCCCCWAVAVAQAGSGDAGPPCRGA